MRSARSARSGGLLFRLRLRSARRATATGMHDHDGSWPDFTTAGRIERLAFCDVWTERFREFGADCLHQPAETAEAIGVHKLAGFPSLLQRGCVRSRVGRCTPGIRQRPRSSSNS